MSVIGLDFGSHNASFALWFDEKKAVEVIADDLGSRTTPCSVAYRGTEVIVGQAAMAQQHKNPSNTFEDVRAMILNPDITTVFVSSLERDIPVQELVSHYFRNIHNQIKQQVGKAVRECVLTIPMAVEESVQRRLYESAQTGGIRIKSIISDSSSALLAYSLDDISLAAAKVVVVDLGWSKSEISVYSVTGGLFVPIASATSTNVSGQILVRLLAEHCAKDFQRRHKIPCQDNSRSMMRLRRQCEEAMKQLSTGAEATIDIDSLCEGVDYSSKISRARFEDLASIPLVHLKNLVTEALTSASLAADDINIVCMAGGLSSMPRVLTTIKSIFASATFPKPRFEAAEAPCIGAALHGRNLMEQGLLDSAPTVSPVVPNSTLAVALASSAGSTPSVIFPVGTVLPARVALKAGVTQSQGYLRVLVDTTLVGELVFTVAGAPTAAAPVEVEVVVALSEGGALSASVSAEGTELAAVAIPGTA